MRIQPHGSEQFSNSTTLPFQSLTSGQTPMEAPLCQPPAGSSQAPSVFPPLWGLPDANGIVSSAADERAQADQARPFCECARFGKRALSWAFWFPGLSGDIRGSFFDRRNIEFSHEHVKFDFSGDNFGFGPEGTYSEDLSKYNYRWDDTCYDGNLIRRALANMSPMGAYDFFRNNCQDFADRLRAVYRNIKSGT